MRLAARELSKTYGRKRAVDRLSLDLGPGVVGLLGPNGAGKSSLMRVLATVTRPTGGTVTWNGRDVVAHPDPLRRALGYLPQDFGVYPHLSAREFLTYLAAATGLDARSAKGRIAELLQLVNLADVGRRPLGGFSVGMRRRVGIAQALLNDPQVLILDEPTAGLDPEERTRFRELLADLGRDRIVLLSTHIVSDVEAIAGRVLIVAGGRLLYDGPPRADLEQLYLTTVAGVPR
jgi:ABC-2 type transport system ATP-binding protein